METRGTGGAGRSGPVGPGVVSLDDERSTDAELTGTKAAALARALGNGMPALPGFVLTTVLTATDRDAGSGPEVEAAWRRLSGGGEQPLVVRSSSTAEDLAGGSMAGRYQSVVGVVGWQPFVEAVQTVLASRVTAAEGVEGLAGDEPLAVLVQPQLDGAAGGVAFGVEPVSGRSDRIVVVAARDGPGAVVSGQVEATRYVLERDGRVVESIPGEGGARLDRRTLAGLAGLVEEAGRVFGGHQDIEWAADRQGRLRLLQSRPVSTEVRGVPQGPVMGPGPVSETFPEPLSALEQDLWLAPLHDAFVEALRLAGAAEDADLADSPVVAAVGGRVAVDLELVGAVPHRSPPSRLDPRPRWRRLRSAWRIGRLRSALPALAEDVVDQADAALAGVPALDTLTDLQLLAVIDRGSPALVACHAHEILMGQLLDHARPHLTGTSVALRVLAHARQRGTPEEEIVARHPVVLALTGPRIGPGPSLPRPVSAPTWEAGSERNHDAVLREALRLRVRWIQELTGRAAWLLAERLAERRNLAEPDLVRWLTKEELVSLVLGGGSAPTDLAERSGGAGGAPLPAQFQLSPEGRPIPVLERAGSGGTGAGGGTGQGPVAHHGDDVEDGVVLVVATLDPALATMLPRLAGLVCETGNVLAHIAILARESGVPTVVGLAGAVRSFPPGTMVRVDGDGGQVERIGET